MNFKPGIRSSVIILFLGLYLTSLFVINIFFSQKQKITRDAFKDLDFDKKFSALNFQTQQDSLKALELLNEFNETIARTEMVQNEAQAHSAILLFIVMVLSIIIFIMIFYKITKPLKDLQLATAKIRDGDFSVQLPETGIREIKELKQSFNSMSQELDLVQKKIVEAEKLMIWKELSRMLAHEIKNPLTPIQLSVQRMEEKYQTDRFQSVFPESIKIINQEIDNLYELARSFSTFAKQIEPVFSKFGPYQKICEIIDSYRKNYEIMLQGDKDCRVQFDPLHFYQIITNILQNSIDASSENGKIEISVKNTDDRILISVVDNGIGIEEKHREMIFEPYFSKKKKGIGLGLALVKKLAEINRAEIKLESKVNVGTKFYLEMECEKS